MYVCVCEAVTHTQVDGAIHAGAQSIAEVTRACRAGGDCGSCHALIDEMIEGHCKRACASSHAGAERAGSPPQSRRLTLLPSHAP